ncbi:MAG: glycosyltransferase, partial [Mariniphaga sp.]
MKIKAKKRIIVSVTSDLVSDNRVHKTCTTLTEMGFEVLLVGRKLPDSQPLSPRIYSAKRLKLLFRKGPLFYACLNLRLFCLLLFSKFDLLLANDLDTLPANFLASKLKNRPLVYDSHEFFTEVPELVHRPR